MSYEAYCLTYTPTYRLRNIEGTSALMRLKSLEIRMPVQQPAQLTTLKSPNSTLMALSAWNPSESGREYRYIYIYIHTLSYIYTLSYYHHQIGSMIYYPLFRIRSWNNGVRCRSFCILIGWSEVKRFRDIFIKYLKLIATVLVWFCFVNRMSMNIMFNMYMEYYSTTKHLIENWNTTRNNLFHLQKRVI